MKIRSIREIDTEEMIHLFRQTVHTVCVNDYTPEQLNAWAPKTIDKSLWEKRFLETHTFIAEANSRILGFSNLESSGNIDMFYVAFDVQKQGVARALMNALNDQARKMELKKLTSDVSLTAKPFFLAMGFEIDQVYQKERAGVVFTNTLMSKKL